MHSGPDNEGLRRLFELAPEMLCIATTEGTFLHVNPAFTSVLGHSADALVATSFLDLIHEDDRERTLRELEQLSTGRKTIGFENRYRHADGSYRLLEWSSIPNEQGSVVYATARDVTELARVKAELARSERVLHHAAHNALLGGWECDYRTDRSIWSEQVCRIYDLPLDFDPNSLDSWYQFFPPMSQMVVDAALQHTQATGTSWDIECRAITARGREKWVRMTGERVLDETGQAIGLRGSLQDITERREQERLHREFLSTISHEVRAPLSSVVAALQLASESARRMNATGELDELLALALRNSERLARILDDVVDGENVADGHVELSAVRVCSGHIVARTVEQTQVIAEVESTQLDIDQRYDGPVVGDTRRVIQALTELVTNAVRHAKNARVTIRVSKQDGIALFEVLDDSPLDGRAEGYSTQPVSASMRAPGKLRSGLEVARRLIALQGGSVGARETVDAAGEVGGVFWFTLPIPPDRGRAPR